MSANRNLYDRDFYAWSREQAELLRSGRIAEADLANIAEEIESMGKTEKRELMSRLAVLLLHLAKWQFQPSLQSRSWRLGIEGQRIDLSDLLDENPSLRPHVEQAIGQAWRRARLDGQRETGLEAGTFPTSCPWSAEQVLDDAFWPQ